MADFFLCQELLYLRFITAVYCVNSCQAKIKQKIREIEENQKRIEKLEDYITTSRYVPHMFEPFYTVLCLPYLPFSAVLKHLFW